MKPKEEVPTPVPHPQPSPVSNPQTPMVTQPAQQNPLNLQPRPQQQQPPQQQPLDPNNEIVQGLQHKEASIQELMSMGFARPEVEQALVAAYYNKERAIDYLINGIPPHLFNTNPTQGVPQPGHQNAPAQGQPQAQGGPQQIQITEEQLNQIQQLVSNPAFEQLRQQAQSNPQILPQLLLMLQQNHPELYQLFTQNPQLLIALLMGNMPGVEGDFEGEEEDVFGENPNAVELTDEDYQVIQNVG